LHLVPLEALPQDDGTPVGERVRVVIEPSRARFARPAAPPNANPTLVALGGVDYGARVDAPLGGKPAPPDLLAARVDGHRKEFLPLLQTRLELDAIAALFTDAFGTKPVLLEKADASSARLTAAVEGARYVHLATHGWFAPDSFPSWEDAQ